MKFRIELVRSRTVCDYAEIIVDVPSSSEAWTAANDAANTEDSVKWTRGDIEDVQVAINSVTGI